MTKDVYVLISGGKHEQYYVIGAYSSRKLAIKCARETVMKDYEVSKEELEVLISDLGKETQLEIYSGQDEPDILTIHKLLIIS